MHPAPQHDGVVDNGDVEGAEQSEHGGILGCLLGLLHEGAQEEIGEFLSALRLCDSFSDVKQESTTEVRLSGERVLEFQIGLTSHAGIIDTQLAKVGEGR